MQRREITVVGLGYIGLPTAVVMAGAGHHVKGFDAKKEVCESLNEGRIHIVENHLQEAFTEVLENGCLEIVSEIPASDIYVICVPTPFLEEEQEKVADLSYVESAAREVAKVLKEGDLVILESTVPPHTTAWMGEILSKVSGLPRAEFYTAHCPERVLPGRILYELKHNDRIIGAEDPKAAQMTRELYETFVEEGNCYVCDDVTAELCKLAENTFRDINIAYANQLSMLCEKAGIDVFRLIQLANKHPRVSILTPGLGVGGHCLAVDPWFIVEKYQEDASLIRTAREINERKPFWVKDQIRKELGGDLTKKIGILGMAYKPNIDDMRESPSLALAGALVSEGYQVFGCEPNSRSSEISGIPLLSLEALLNQCDYLVIALAHDEFQDEAVRERIREKPHYDCIGFLRSYFRWSEKYLSTGIWI